MKSLESPLFQVGQFVHEDHRTVKGQTRDQESPNLERGEKRKSYRPDEGSPTQQVEKEEIGPIDPSLGFEEVLGYLLRLGHWKSFGWFRQGKPPFSKSKMFTRETLDEL